MIGPASACCPREPRLELGLHVDRREELLGHARRDLLPDLRVVDELPGRLLDLVRVERLALDEVGGDRDDEEKTPRTVNRRATHPRQPREPFCSSTTSGSGALMVPSRPGYRRRALRGWPAAVLRVRAFAQIPRICFFLASNSSSVMIPLSLSCASCASSAA